MIEDLLQLISLTNEEKTVYFSRSHSIIFRSSVYTFYFGMVCRLYLYIIIIIFFSIRVVFAVVACPTFLMLFNVQILYSDRYRYYYNTLFGGNETLSVKCLQKKSC